MENLYLFFIASLMLNLTPGSDMLYVASRSISQGSKAGIYAAIGIFLGGLVHIVAAVLGLSLIVAKSALAFSIIKFAGAAYLIYLGIKSLLTKAKHKNLETLPSVSKWELLKQGVITCTLNPKVAIFFLSFLPQFVNSASPIFKFQLFTLGIWFDIQGSLILIVMAYFLGKSTNFIKQNPKVWAIQEKLSGLILMGLGVKLALASRK